MFFKPLVWGLEPRSWPCGIQPSYPARHWLTEESLIQFLCTIVDNPPPGGHGLSLVGQGDVTCPCSAARELGSDRVSQELGQGDNGCGWRLAAASVPRAILQTEGRGQASLTKDWNQPVESTQVHLF